MKQAVNLVIFLATLYIAAKFLMAKAQPRVELAQGEFDYTGLKKHYQFRMLISMN